MPSIVATCALLVFALCHVTVVFADTLTLAPDLQSLQLGLHVQHLEDPDGNLTIDQVRRSAGWISSEQDVLSFGYSPSAYWVRFDLLQGGDLARPYFLEIAYPVLDHVDVHVFEKGVQIGYYRMGDQWAYSQRPVDNPNYLVPLLVHPTVNTTVYLRILSTSAVQIPLTLYQDLNLIEVSYDRGILQALFYGAMLAMAIYNLLVFLSIRDISYLYSVLFLISVSLLLAGIEGLTFKYIWPNTTWLNDSTLLVALSGVVAFSALFFRSFLDIPKARPLLGKVILGLATLSLFTVIGAFFLPYRPMMLLTILMAVGAIMTGMWAAIIRWRDGFVAARYLTIAWSFVLIAGLVFALNKLGVLPRNGFTENVMQIGTALQALLLSFALAYRMTSERDMRERAQQESVAAQRALLEQKIRANEGLDRLVQQRTEELQQANEKLKEIGATDSLTDMLNRRAFEERFHIEYERAYRNQSSLAILMIDLDHFKRINDEYGHPFGDLCLVKAAEVISASACRPTDVAARYGGEEFILMLPDTNVQGAVNLAQTILNTLAATEVTDGGYSVIMSASVGVAAGVLNHTGFYGGHSV